MPNTSQLIYLLLSYVSSWEVVTEIFVGVSTVSIGELPKTPEIKDILSYISTEAAQVNPLNIDPSIAYLT